MRFSVSAALLLAVLTAGCGDDSSTRADLGADADGGADAEVDLAPDAQTDRDSPDAGDAAQGQAPTISPPAVPVTLEPGGSTVLDLRNLVSDADTVFDDLVLSATSSAHVTATIAADDLVLAADAGWTGTESVGLRAEDPEGNSADGMIDVAVEEAGLPVENLSASPRSCDAVFTWDTFFGSATSVSVAGEFNEWSTSADPLTDQGDGTWSAALPLPPGDYGYKLVLDGGDWREDPDNPYTVVVGDVLNSLAIVEDCSVPSFEVVSVSPDPGAGRVRWEIRAWDAGAGAGLDGDALTLSVNRESVPASAVTIEGSLITVDLTGLSAPNRYTLRAGVADAVGRQADELYAPVWLEAQPFGWQDAVIYFAFVDRFANGDTGNDAPQPASNAIVDWMGGDWAGLLDVIESGYFEELGVNTLWLTSPNDNPDTLVTGSLGDQRTAYHGYFPASPRSTENHFGSLDALRAVVDAAHRRGLRVITDLVANHVFESHPYWTGRTNEDEFNAQEMCRDINWERPITCWFEPYLPDLNYGLRDNVRRTVADAVWWIEAADLDGFRMDAVKHMDHNLGYLLRAAVDRAHAGLGLHFYMIGETFTGTWSDDEANLLAEYISPAELTGQFNFPVYWEIIRTVARREAGFVSFASLDAVLGLSETWFPPPAVMGTFAGNHDVARLASHAAGQIDDLWGNGSQEQGLSNPPPQPADAEPYDRVALALTLVLTLPGVPVLYYGDEVGLAGAGDPDNRRFMPSDASLNVHQTALRQRVGQLGQLRQARAELRRGGRTTLSTANDTYIFARHLGSAVAVVALNNATTSRTIDVAVSAWLTDGAVLNDALDGGGDRTVAGGRVVFELPPMSARVYTTP